MPVPAPKTPLFRKCDKIGLAAAALVLALTVLASATFAGTPTMSNSFVSDLQMRGFNPQPEPPPARAGYVSEAAAKRGFNPQPEPPASKLSLNPQPEPPSKR